MISKTEAEQKGYIYLHKNEIGKKIRKDLKNYFGKTAKFSVTTEYSYTILVTIKIKALNEKYFKNYEEFEKENINIKIYDPILYNSLFDDLKNHNENSIKNNILKKIIEISNNYNYNNNDIMTDYFDMNYNCRVFANNVEVI